MLKNKSFSTVAVVSSGMRSEAICLYLWSRAWSIPVAGKTQEVKQIEGQVFTAFFLPSAWDSIFPSPQRHYGETPFSVAAVFFEPNTKIQ